MIKGVVKLFAVCAAVLLLACSSANNKPLLIDFSADSAAIVFNQIDQPGLLQLRAIQNSDTTLNNLVSVLQTPSEREPTLKEAPVAGTFKLTDSALVFIPDRPFIKGRDYLVITHLNARFGETKDLISGKLNNRVKPLQKMLTR